MHDLSGNEFTNKESREEFEKILDGMERRDIKRMRDNLEIDSKKSFRDRPGQTRDEKLAFLPEGGFHVLEGIRGGTERTGITRHRTVLHAKERVDHELLIDMLEDEMGYTFDEVRLAFGATPGDAREMRQNIINKLVEIYQAGGNIKLLADLFGIPRGTIAVAIHREKQRRKGNDNAER